MWRTSVVLAVVALASPTTASAHHTKHHSRRPATNPITVAVERAEQYWGHKPCGGEVTVTTEAFSAQERAEELSAYVSFQTPSGLDDLAADPASYSQCVVHLSRAEFPSWEEDDEDFPELCQLMTHELGHFEGYSDVGAVEGTIQSRNLNDVPIVPQCRKSKLWYGHEWIIEEVA